MSTTTRAALQGTAVSPGLTVNDLARSIAFYEALGCVVTERWENEGTLRGVMMGGGAVNIGLSQDDWKKGRDRVKGVGVRLWLVTKQDIEEVAGRARAAGIQLDSEPHETDWGSRMFELTDPDGFKLTIVHRA